MKSSIALAAAMLLTIPALPLTAAPLPTANVTLKNVQVDLTANTATFPLHKGSANGKTVWYLLTDASQATAAKTLGVNFSPVLGAAGSEVVAARGTIGHLIYPGGVDFTPTRVLTVGADGAPTAAKPGSIGDPNYSPLVRLPASPVVYNAPIVASGEHPHDLAGHSDVLDRVVAIDTTNAAKASVTLVLARGYTNGAPIAYISTDASAEGPAAIERSTYVPRLAKVAGAIPIDVLFNGPVQGIPFAGLKGHLADDATAANAATIGSPLNIQATFPAANGAPSGYNPLWSVFPGAWSKDASAAGKAVLLTSTTQVDAAAKAGDLTAPDGKPFGAAGIVVNCPVVGFEATRP